MGSFARDRADYLISLIDKRLIVLIIITLVFLNFLYPPNTYWLSQESEVKQYLRDNIDTDYTYITIEKIIRAPIQMVRGNLDIEPWFGPKDGRYFRYFFLYKYPRSEVPLNENFRIEGWVDLNGKIKITGHVRADTVYI